MASLVRTFQRTQYGDEHQEQIRLNLEREAAAFFNVPEVTATRKDVDDQTVEWTITTDNNYPLLHHRMGSTDTGFSEMMRRVINSVLAEESKEPTMKKNILGLGRLKGVMDELRNDVRKEVDGAVDMAVAVKADATKAVDGFKQTISAVKAEVAEVVDELAQATNGGPE